MKNIRLSVILAFSTALGILSSQAEIVDSVVAVVNGEVITLSMVEDAMNAIWVDPQKLPMSRQEALQDLIDHKLMLREARRLGVEVTEIVSAESLTREVASVASRFASPRDFSEALQRLGIMQKDLEEILIEQIMVREMVNRKLRLFVEVTEAEASGYFERHREEFVMPESVHLSQILFQLALGAGEAEKKAVKGRAEEVLNELRSDADFSRYISEKKSDDYIAAEYRYVAIDQLPIPVVAATVPQLEVGEISDLIETPAGYFIIKLNDRRPTRQATFGEVKDSKIKPLLLQQKTDAELEAWLKKQRGLADIRIKVKFKDH